MKLQMKFGFKKAVNGICHCYGFIIHGVLIYIFKHVVCRVPHALHCVLVGDIEPEHNRCVYMAQVVEAEWLNTTADTRALQMLDLNGIETVRRIRKLIGESKPIIILTAYDWADIEQEAREAGVTAFCSKPLFMSELRDVLSQSYRVKKEETPASPYRFEGKKVLLVEDNLLNREIAQAILQDAGFTVDTADDGDVAVERLQDSKQGEFNLVLMDIQMPKMDGYAATRQIRTLPSDAANVPIVAMTANAFEEDKQKAIRAGMNAHIAKPIEAGRLMETLSHILT